MSRLVTYVRLELLRLSCNIVVFTLFEILHQVFTQVSTQVFTQVFTQVATDVFYKQNTT